MKDDVGSYPVSMIAILGLLAVVLSRQALLNFKDTLLYKFEVANFSNHSLDAFLDLASVVGIVTFSRTYSGTFSILSMVISV